MFMEEMTDDQMYELLRYSQRIISKTTALADFVTFLGVKVLPMCKLYFSTKFEPLLV